MIWDELIRLAVVGLDRAEINRETKSFLAQDGLPIDGNPAKILGQALSYYNQLEKGAKELPVFTGTFPMYPDVNDVEYCKQAALDFLQEILHGDYRHALPEYVEALVWSGKVLPPEQLPPLFDECVKNPTLWEMIKPMVGALGEWLLLQNKAWAKLQYSNDLALWLSVQKEERVALLRYLREHTPEQAIALLESTWKNEKVNDKITFLKIIQTDVLASDEDFLVDLQKDTRKDVRLLATALLAHIPNSEVNQKLRAVAEQCFVVDNNRFFINLPDEVEGSEELGIIVDMSKGHGYGLRVAWLAMIIEKIELDNWCNEWGLTPAQIIQLFAQDTYHDAWMPALAENALANRADDWIQALLLHWKKSARLPLAIIKAMIKALPKTQFQQLTKQLMASSPPLLAEDSLLFILLMHSPHSWPNEVSHKIISNFQKSISAKQTNYWYRPLLKKAAYSINSTLSTQLSKGWPSNSMAWYDWSLAVEQMLTTLEFRKEMLLAIDED